MQAVVSRNKSFNTVLHASAAIGFPKTGSIVSSYPNADKRVINEIMDYISWLIFASIEIDRNGLCEFEKKNKDCMLQWHSFFNGVLKKYNKK